MNPAFSSSEGLRPVTAADLTALNAALERLPAQEILLWARGVFGPRRLAALSAMQKAGCALCHLIARLGLQSEVDVLFVDTGVNFRETYETLERLRGEYGLNILSLRPALTMEEQTRREGVLYLTPEGQKRCCHLRKKEPLLQIRGRYDALLGSLRREEGGRRAAIPALALDEELNLLRIHPLLAWDSARLAAYLAQNNVIVNPLHAQGYPTIGCDRCTTPVLPGEPERAGRWRHLEGAPKYCNINPTDRSAAAETAPPVIDLPAELARRLLDSPPPAASATGESRP